MPFVFSHVEYCDMHFVYGFCNGNARAAVMQDGVNNLRNVHTWSHDNPHETSVTNFHRRFTVNVWCGVLGNKLIGHRSELFKLLVWFTMEEKL